MPDQMRALPHRDCLLELMCAQILLPPRVLMKRRSWPDWNGWSAWAAWPARLAPLACRSLASRVPRNPRFRPARSRQLNTTRARLGGPVRGRRMRCPATVRRERETRASSRPAPSPETNVMAAPGAGTRADSPAPTAGGRAAAGAEAPAEIVPIARRGHRSVPVGTRSVPRRPAWRGPKRSAAAGMQSSTPSARSAGIRLDAAEQRQRRLTR